MTIDEYAEAVEKKIATAPNLEVWEVHDLRLLLRFARKRGEVRGFDTLFLDLVGRFHHGQLKRPPTPMEFTDPIVRKPKQKTLF